MDPTLVFNILVVAKGYEPTFFNKVDPRNGPLEAIIKERPVLNLPPGNIILGRVLDDKGNPQPNSVVSVSSIRNGNRISGRTPEGTDPIAVTDTQGDFFISSRQPFDSMELEVEARGFARKRFMGIEGGSIRYPLVVTEGTYLNGRVLHQGKPLGGITIGVVSTDRTINNFTGEFVIATAVDGTFQIRNLPANREYQLYAHMAPLQHIGTIPSRRVGNQDDGTTLNVGDMEVENGLRLAGQVILSDSNSIPANTRLVIGRRDAWDSRAIELPADGRFDVNHVPPESLSIGVRLKGYRPSARNASLDRMNPFGLVGFINGDKTNLTILLEPGDILRGEFSHGSMEDLPENQPLYGIEERPSNPGQWFVTGQAFDAENRKPLQQYRITSGQHASLPSDFVLWANTTPTYETNGVFQFQFKKMIDNLTLRIEAKGYLPVLTNLALGQTNCTFYLKKGSGPSGVIRFSEDKPAPGVTLYYIAAQDQMVTGEKGELILINRDPESITKSDEQGRFEFAPKLGCGEIVASHSSGFARLAIATLPAQVEIKIQPWAAIHGRLVKQGKPVAGEDIDIVFADTLNMQRRRIYLSRGRTDSEGYFKIEYLPAGKLQLCTRNYMGTGMKRSWTTQAQITFTSKSGTDTDLGDIEKSK